MLEKLREKAKKELLLHFRMFCVIFTIVIVAYVFERWTGIRTFETLGVALKQIESFIPEPLR